MEKESSCDHFSYNDISVNGKKAFDFFEALIEVQRNQKNYIVGRVLTVIDALSMQTEQRKAAKDLIRSAFDEFQVRQNFLAGEIYSRVSESLCDVIVQRSEDIEDGRAVYLPSIVKE